MIGTLRLPAIAMIVLCCGLAAAQEQSTLRVSDEEARATPHRPGADGDIDVVFDRNKGALYALYGRALRDNPKLEGNVVFEFTVQTTGETTGCRIVSSELNAPDLEQKMCARINRILSKPREAAKTTTKTLSFFPAS